MPGFFDGPETVAVGDDGLAYLLDVPPRVQRLGLEGTVQAQIDAPEFTHIHHYRCLACGHCWTTNLKGDRIFTGQDDDLMLFV